MCSKERKNDSWKCSLATSVNIISIAMVKCLWPISLWAVSRELFIVSGKFKARVDGLHLADRNES
jgi:hypothetical protein